MNINSYLRRFLNWFAFVLSPWHDNGLPEHLRFGEIESEGFVRGSMLRTASLSVGTNMTFGIFEIIGLEHARRALWAWRPRHILLMEDLSMAFYPIANRAPGPHPVPEIHIDRSVTILEIYLNYMRTPRSREDLRAAINQYIADQ